MDTAALDVDGLLGFPVEGALDKAERLDFGESLMTHAMVLEGVRLDGAGRPALWKVENSWGKDHGRDGFDTLSDAWFDEYVYQVVVDRAYLTDEERAAYGAEPVVLEPWDPMGALTRASPRPPRPPALGQRRLARGPGTPPARLRPAGAHQARRRPARRPRRSASARLSCARCR